MSTGTSLVTFKQALRTALTARPGMSGVQVSYAFPEDDLQAESLWFEDAVTSNEIPVMKAGTKKVDEEYTLDAVIQVLKQQGESQETADLRAAALLAELQQALAENPQITPEIQWVEMAGWEHTPGKLNAGHGSRFNVTLRVRARLFP